MQSNGLFTNPALCPSLSGQPLSSGSWTSSSSRWIRLARFDPLPHAPSMSRIIVQMTGLMRISCRYPILSAALAYGLAHAELSVEIIGAGANRIPVAIAGFPGERIVSQALTSVIRNDLDRSGL